MQILNYYEIYAIVNDFILSAKAFYVPLSIERALMILSRLSEHIHTIDRNCNKMANFYFLTKNATRPQTKTVKTKSNKKTSENELFAEKFLNFATTVQLPFCKVST